MEDEQLYLQGETSEIYYYHCTECSKSVEILSLDNNIIKFICINEKDKHEKEMTLKDYIKKIKLNQKSDTNNSCLIHHKEYKYFCVDCNKHLCEKCLETRDHYNHIKNDIEKEIQPKKSEIKKFEDIIKEMDMKIEECKIKNANANDINNLKDIKELYDIIYNTYNDYRNNYYNSININKILINYYNNKNDINNNEYKNLAKIKKYEKLNFNEDERSIDGIIKENKKLIKEKDDIKLQYKNIIDLIQEQNIILKKLEEGKNSKEEIEVSKKDKDEKIKIKNELEESKEALEMKSFENELMKNQISKLDKELSNARKSIRNSKNYNDRFFQFDILKEGIMKKKVPMTMLFRLNKENKKGVPNVEVVINRPRNGNMKTDTINIIGIRLSINEKQKDQFEISFNVSNIF